MADQAEILRKRREARQKKILASGESRLSKITGTAGTSAQVAPSPAVMQAREQMLRKEQDEKLKALRPTGSDATGTGEPETNTSSLPRTHQHLDAEEEELVMPHSLQQRAAIAAATAANRIANDQPSPSILNTTTTTTSPASHSNNTTEATSKPAPETLQDPNDADPDDSLGAPSSQTPAAQQNPFMNNPFYSPQHQQALARLMQEDNGRSTNDSKVPAQQQGESGNVPSGFTVITPQVDQTARWWKLLHFVLSVLFGLSIVYREYRLQGDLRGFDPLATDKPEPYGAYQVVPMPVFWYFVTMELILQSTRMYLQGMTASPSSTLGTIAGLLPPPFSDAIRVFMRYRLIWTSMANDLSVVVFIVGLTIAFTHMFS
ncbi:hypothetical protein BGZ65_000930 [Modicella reniformis]|uniref:Uncharacterized protein n=1 Tax=Modicella reniformis TaxID=1440133 RepID=A0A9P6M144_9FUNG|nr:hypothetical protein BGZ65_000930 [Modicella reniformis]